MKLDAYFEKLVPIKNFFVRYAVIIFVLVIVTIFGAMTFMIARYANLDPTSSQGDERTSTVTTVRLDEKSVTKLQSLEDQNISIESLFDNGRDNPFQ